MVVAKYGVEGFIDEDVGRVLRSWKERGLARPQL